MTTAQVVETSVTIINSSFQKYIHPDDHTRQTTDVNMVTKTLANPKVNVKVGCWNVRTVYSVGKTVQTPVKLIDMASVY